MKLNAAVAKLEGFMAKDFLSPYYEFVTYVNFLSENTGNARSLLEHLLSFFGTIPKDGIAIGMDGIPENSWNELVSLMRPRVVFFASDVRDLDLKSAADLLRKELKKFQLLDEKAAFMHLVFKQIAPFRKAENQIQMSESEFRNRIAGLRRTMMEIDAINGSPLMNSITKGAETFRIISSLADERDRAAITRYLTEKSKSVSIAIGMDMMEHVLPDPFANPLSDLFLSGGKDPVFDLFSERDPGFGHSTFGQPLSRGPRSFNPFGDEDIPFLDFLKDLAGYSITGIPEMDTPDVISMTAGEDYFTCPVRGACPMASECKDKSQAKKR